MKGLRQAIRLSWVAMLLPATLPPASSLAAPPLPATAGDAVAAVQFAPWPGRPERNRDELTALVTLAARGGARYVVLPELALDAPAETVPGPSTQHFAELARRLGVWLALSVKERAEHDGQHYVTTVLLGASGLVEVSHRKVMSKLGREEPGLRRGNPRVIVHTIDDGRRRVAVLSGDDLKSGVPRLANLGADTILVAADWGPSAPVAWRDECAELSRGLRVNLAVADRREAGPKGAGRVYLRDGATPDPKAGERLATARLPAPLTYASVRTALGLPSVPIPSALDYDPALVELGRKLFFDERLSSSGNVACATCHQPARGFTNGARFGEGVYGRHTLRNVPSLLNVAYKPVLHWDGYASSIENQAKYPMSGVYEMNFHYLDQVTRHLRADAEYVAAFKATLGAGEITFDHVARALAAYQRTLVSGGSAFDRHHYGGEPDALTPQARRGLQLFVGRAGCVRCHHVGDRYALFMDFGYHNLGVGYDAATDSYLDAGVGKISHADKAGLFFTPSLRNVAVTGPYMHDGSIATLEDAVELHNRGGVPNPNLDPLMRPLGLEPSEVQELVAFLRSLTGAQVYTATGERQDAQPRSYAHSGR